MRTVAFRSADIPAEETRDRDAEIIFCGDVKKLQSRFAEAGSEIVIVSALPVVAAHLRVVAEISDDKDESTHRVRPTKFDGYKNPYDASPSCGIELKAGRVMLTNVAGLTKRTAHEQ